MFAWHVLSRHFGFAENMSNIPEIDQKQQKSNWVLEIWGRLTDAGISEAAKLLNLIDNANLNEQNSWFWGGEDAAYSGEGL